MSGIVTLVLRGISGVGKTFLTKCLKHALIAAGKKFLVISKDKHRALLAKSGGYHYSPEEEEDTTRWYSNTYNDATQDPSIDYIICDNTHTRARELVIPTTPSGRVSKIVVIDVGSWKSETQSKIGDEIISRQRRELRDSDVYLQNIYLQGYVERFWLPAKCQYPTDEAHEIVKECELINC